MKERWRKWRERNILISLLKALSKNFLLQILRFYAGRSPFSPATPHHFLFWCHLCWNENERRKLQCDEMMKIMRWMSSLVEREIETLLLILFCLTSILKCNERHKNLTFEQNKNVKRKMFSFLLWKFMFDVTLKKISTELFSTFMSD